MNPDIIPFPRRVAAPVDSSISVLVVTNDPSIGDRLAADVQTAGFHLKRCATVDAAVQILSTVPSDICIVGPLGLQDSVAQLAGQISQRGWATQLLQVASHPGEFAQHSTVAGVEHLTWPVNSTVFYQLVSGAAQRGRLSSENRRLKRQISNRNLRDMVGHSPAMQTFRQQIQHAAEQAGSVLIVAEPGAGATIAAQSIHEASRRGSRPFIRVDCHVLSVEALEVELFGAPCPPQEDGRQHLPGRIHQAEGGTIYLDGIDNLAIPAQRRLLNLVRQQRREHPITGEPIRADVRIMASTSIRLTQLVSRNLFRADLAEALQDYVVEVPALRERPEDIATLAEHFLHRVSVREGRPPRMLTVEAIDRLRQWKWPGNIRELENVIDRACSIDCSHKLTAEMIEPWIQKPLAQEEEDIVPGLTLAEMERKLIESTFTRFEGNREKTARALQIGIRTLSGKLREYGYPPRGGPGSNRIAAPAETVETVEPMISTFETRAA